MKNILLINRGSDTDNIGDEAINYTLKKLLETLNCEVVTANYTLLFKKSESGIKSIIKNIWTIFKISRRKYNHVMIGGGQLIQSNNRFPLSLLVWVFFLKISRQKILLYGVGVDEYFSKKKRGIFKISFYFISSFYVRDRKSQENLEKIFNKESLVVADSVFCISEFYKPYTSLKTQRGYKLFGITHYSSIKRYGFMNVEKEEEYLKEQSEFLIELDLQDNFQIICNTNSDFEYAKIFQKYIFENYKKEYQIINPKNLFDYINIVDASDLVVSSRMHALIIAHSYRVKILPIERNNKLKTFNSYYESYNPIDCYNQNINALKYIFKK